MRVAAMQSSSDTVGQVICDKWPNEPEMTRTLIVFEMPEREDRPTELRLELDGERAHMPICKIVKGPLPPITWEE